jgi:hypothetical protein
VTESRSALAWGAALVVLGGVLLLRSIDVIPASVSAWPWAILAAGFTLLAHPAARRRSEVALPLALIIVGGVFALREVGILSGVPVAPVVLIIVGIAVLTGALSRDEQRPPESLTHALDGAARARIALHHGAGTLRVTGGASNGLAFEGSFVGGAHEEAARTGDHLDATLRHPRDVEGYIRSPHALDWDVALTNAIPVDLDVRSGASRVHLDVSTLTLSSLSLKTGASETDIDLPDRGRFTVDIDAGAAEVTVRVPPGMAASIRSRSALATVDVDEARFPRAFGGFRSPDFDAAEHRTEIDIEGGVASFTVR